MIPKISVVMSVYNGEQFISKTINSVLNQSFKDLELIISNNGSTDNTKNIILEYAKKDNRVMLFDHENLGFANSLNEAIKLAQSNIIARIDADDIMEINRLEEQFKFLNEHKEATVISCLAHYINENDKVIGKTFSDIKSIEDNQEYFKKNEPVGILHPGTMYYKNRFLEIGGYREQFFPTEDIDLWARFNESGYWIIVQQKILMNYRISTSSEVTTKFMNSRKYFEWNRECMWLRRAKKNEMTWEEFVKKQTQLSIFTKINKNRKNYAKYFYRNAGFDFAGGNYFKFIYKLGLAFVLQPLYVVKKLIKQKI